MRRFLSIKFNLILVVLRVREHSFLKQHKLCNFSKLCCRTRSTVPIDQKNQALQGSCSMTDLSGGMQVMVWEIISPFTMTTRRRCWMQQQFLVPMKCFSSVMQWRVTWVPHIAATMYWYSLSMACIVIEHVTVLTVFSRTKYGETIRNFPLLTITVCINRCEHYNCNHTLANGTRKKTQTSSSMFWHTVHTNLQV